MANTYRFRPMGVCSQMMTFTIEGNTLEDAQIYGGCGGNTQGVCALAKGRPVEEVISIIEGIRCGQKPTSCPDQLARGLRMALDAEREGK